MSRPEQSTSSPIDSTRAILSSFHRTDTYYQKRKEEERRQQYRQEFAEYANLLVNVDAFPSRDMYSPDEESPYGYSESVTPMPLLYLDRVPHGQLQDEAFLEPSGRILLFEVNEGASSNVYSHGREATTRQYEDLRAVIPQAADRALAAVQTNA